ncbi:hypothetical protein [Rhodococcus sp. NPDC060176]|uniref:hypothetical protein n=1 Tax=Rhodococcus sp. NPDC060176 TaxID=3347062 RepID=UPI00364886B2
MTSADLAGIAVALIDDHDVVHEGFASWCAGATPPIASADEGHLIHAGFRTPDGSIAF